MEDYVLSYDICGLLIMAVFSVYYFSRKRFKSLHNQMFNLFIVLVSVSIVFDILAVTTLKYRFYLPVWNNYLSNILYFLFTGAMSVAFCFYTLVETKSIREIDKHNRIMWLLLAPYLFFSCFLITTPWTHIVFYLDENLNYRHGPLMNILLLIVVAYLFFSFIRITFYHDNITLKQRVPYYFYMSFMVLAIFLQWAFPQYLMYGFAESVGIIMLYVNNHNPNDMLDMRTGLFNRHALFLKLNDIDATSKNVCITGFAVKDFLLNRKHDEALYSDYIYAQIGSFFTQAFGEENVFFVDNSEFCILSGDSPAEKSNVVEVIDLRFMETWHLREIDISLSYGISRISFPNDTEIPATALDYISDGIHLSFDADGALVGLDEIKAARDRELNELEKRSKRLEEQYNESRIQMQQALDADRSKTLFLAQMSHEIRTPMTAILGMTELLMRDSNDTRVLEHAVAIQNSGKTLLGLINDILDFSKIEAGKLDIIKEEYYITSTVEDVINSVAQRVSDKRLDFDVYFQPDIPASMYGDEVRIKQIITNLLTNAVKYTEKGTVKLSFTQQVLDEDSIELIISVSDTGIGIAEENLPKLFNGFERFDTLRNKAIEGTGLGLAITKQLVEAMDGTIIVDSVYGEGSTFTVRIPQKIIDLRNAVTIRDADKFRMLVYCGTVAEREAFERTFADFGISADYAMYGEELNNYLEHSYCYSHIFVTYGEFERRVNASDALMDDPRLVVCLYFRQHLCDLKGHNGVYLPICSINLASLIQGKSVVENSTYKNQAELYIGPEVNLLVVDDNLVNLRIFSGLLDCHRFKIDCVDSGMKCIDYARNKKYDLIFLDHMMPKKDGIATLHEMREDEKTLNKNTPVIAFTANAVSGMKEMFFEQGFEDFLSKPIDIAKMEEILKAYLPFDKLIPVDEYPEDSAVGENTDGMSDGAGRSESEFTVEGLDMEKALYYAGGSYATLKNVLEVFLSDGRNKESLITTYVENGDFENYRIEIHAVKSLCKGIGADELSGRALALEDACKRGDKEFVLSNYLAVSRDYGSLLDEIEKTLSGIKSDSKRRTATAEPVLTVGEQLLCAKLLLDEFEQDTAGKLIDDLLERDTDDELAAKLKDIKNKFMLCDFDGALELITEAADEG